METLYPHGVTIDPQGMIWFTEMAGGHVGRLDPTMGQIHIFTAPWPNTSLMEIAGDAGEIIWMASFSSCGAAPSPRSPHTASFTRYDASSTVSGAGGLYGLAVTLSGEVWITILSENMLARLDRAAGRFTYYSIPTPNSEPLAVAVGTDHTLWFSEVNQLGMLQP